ncbi:MAG: polyribonucleotide nucleotidyltransferase [Patescibacteria group bacterium]
MERKTFETTLRDKRFVVEFTPLTTQTNSSVLVSCGETTVLANVVMGGNARENIDHFPLTVDYEEKFYAAGRILGSRFLRREGRPSEEAILVSRLIDRALRPLFDNRLRRETQVTALALSIDEKNDPDVVALLATSLALLTSDVPWNGPVSAVRIGNKGNTRLINPTYDERKESDYDIVAAGTHEHINMMEGDAAQTSEEELCKALQEAQEVINQLNDFQNKVARAHGKEKQQIVFEEPSGNLRHFFDQQIRPRLADAVFVPTKTHRETEIGVVRKEWTTAAFEREPTMSPPLVDHLFEEALNEIVHAALIDEGKRPDGRKADELRPLMAETGFLPRTHGSGVFFRGDTHILSVVTLGAPGDELLIEGMEVRMKKHFIHHYNFPPFSVGETGRMGAPGRREIGHGALAERALRRVIPERDVFPYTIRVVSETLSSNGSSSMGSVCASTLALMDAGVPISDPVAGIAMGVMIEAQSSKLKAQKYTILTDIQGPEDHYGDMDFKVAGTRKGVTAVQMDVKIEGVSVNLLREAFAQAKKARLQILEVMVAAIAEPRKELSLYAPRVLSLTIPVDKIREVVGPGGKVINEIIAQTGAEVDIEQTGKIYITGPTKKAAEQALARIEEITHEYEVGETFENGRVTRIFGFGAMVEFAPGQEGLVHISELAPFRVNVVEDVVETGDVVPVKIVGIDEQGRINLSIKALTTLEPKPAGHRPTMQDRDRRDRGGFDRRGGGGRPPHRDHGGGHRGPPRGRR